MQLVLDKFLQKEDTPINLHQISIKDLISMLRDGAFDKYFDRKRIVNYLRHIAENIKEYCRREYCPRCVVAT